MPSLSFPILDTVDRGHGALTLREDFREHVRAVQRDIGFASIRGHGLLNDDMSVALPIGRGPEVGANLFNVFRRSTFT